MRFVCTLVLLLQYWGGSTQVYWNKQIDWQQNDEYLNGLALLPNGNIFLAGGEEGHNPFHQASFIVNMSPEGSTVWENSFLPQAGLYGNTASLICDSSGMVVQEGNYFISPDSITFDLQIFVTKMDGGSGDTLWNRSYGLPGISDNGIKIIPTSDGGYAIAGWAFADNNTQHSRILLLKIDKDGNQIFRKEYSTDFQDDHFSASLIQTSDGGFLILAYRSYEGPFSGGFGTEHKVDIVLLKINNQGVEEWSKILPPWEWKQILFLGLDILPLENDQFIVSGLKGYALYQPGMTYAGHHFFAKFTSTGAILDSITLYETNEYNHLGRIIRSSDGNFLGIGAEKDLPNTGQTGVIIKLSPDLDLLWKREYRVSPPEASIHDIFYDGLEMPDHGFILCGSAYGPILEGTHANGWVIRVDPLGCLDPGCQGGSSPTMESPAEAGLYLAPNPTDGPLDISLQHPEAFLLTVRVVNLFGQELLHREFARTAGWKDYRLDLSQYTTGSYLLQIRTSEGWTAQKIIKK